MDEMEWDHLARLWVEAMKEKGKRIRESQPLLEAQGIRMHPRSTGLIPEDLVEPLKTKVLAILAGEKQGTKPS